MGNWTGLDVIVSWRDTELTPFHIVINYLLLAKCLHGVSISVKLWYLV